MAKSPSLAHKLFENSLEIVSRGFLNNAAVSRLIGAHICTLRDQIDGRSRWTADNWLRYMLAIGAIYYEDGYLKMALKVPPEFQKAVSKMHSYDKSELFSARHA